MQIYDISISQLHEYENNPRNADDAVDAVAESIKEFGFKAPIVSGERKGNGYEIIAGHTRVKAARKIGISNVPCICKG